MAQSQPFPSLFSPLRLRGGTILKNRIMSAPNMLFHTVDGRPTDYYIGYLEHKARGGAAIVNLGEIAVCDGGRHTPPMEMNDDNRPLFGEMAAAIHEHGALASVELTHGGMRARPQFNHRGLLGPDTCVTQAGCQVAAMTERDIDEVAQAFADAALYWMWAGFDAVHIHAGHGWLFPQFLSPRLNHRTDRYGGSLENRMRFPLLVLRRIREQAGKKLVLSMRQSGSERCEGGFTPDDVAQFLARAQEYLDFVEITTEGLEMSMPSTFLPWGHNTDLSAAIKRSGLVQLPVFVIGSILEPAQAEEILTAGKADGISMSRALIADPYLPRKARAGRSEEITPCLRCMNCTDSDNLHRHFVCSVNPLIAREARDGFGEGLPPARHRRRVLVVGGGPAGMKAALTAWQRGHEVILCEQSGQLGGRLNFTETDTLKGDLRRFKDYLVRQVERSGAEIRLNTPVTPELAGALAPDHILVAAGSTPIVPTFLPGSHNARPAWDIYAHPDCVKGAHILIVGGGLVGVEAGLHLCNLGKRVTVFELTGSCAADAGGCYRRGVLWKAEQLGLELRTGARCTEIFLDGISYEQDGQFHRARGDAVFYAVGMASLDQPYFDLVRSAPFVDRIGDCRQVGKVAGAIHSAYFAALDIGLF